MCIGSAGQPVGELDTLAPQRGSLSIEIRKAEKCGNAGGGIDQRETPRGINRVAGRGLPFDGGEN